MEQLLAIFLVVLIVGAACIFREQLGWKPSLEAKQIRDTVGDLLPFMQGVQWEDATRKLTWLVYVRLPQLHQEHREIVDRVQHQVNMVAFFHGIRVRPYDDRIEGIHRLVQNLQEQSHWSDGFTDPLGARVLINSEYDRHTRT